MTAKGIEPTTTYFVRGCSPSLSKWLSVCLQFKWLFVQVRLKSDITPVFSKEFLDSLSKWVCDMIKTHSNKMGYAKPCSHLIPSSPIHSQTLSSTPTHSHPLYSFLTLFHSFSALFRALPHMIGSPLLILNPNPPMCSLSHQFTVYIQIFSPNLIHHLPFQPLFSPYISRANMLYVHMCSYAFVFHVPMYLCNSFLCNLLPMLLYLSVFVCVNTSEIFI